MIVGDGAVYSTTHIGGQYEKDPGRGVGTTGIVGTGKEYHVGLLIVHLPVFNQGCVCLTEMMYDSSGKRANGIHVFVRSNKNTLIGPKIKMGTHAISMDHVLAPFGVFAIETGMWPPN